MKLRSLEVENFGCVRAAQLEFQPGLNVLYGPNDLGKSTLVSALRAALLLPHGSTARQEFVPWARPEAEPSVKLVLETEAQRIYRVSKTFGSSGSSRLEQSRDGLSYTTQATAREVDGKLRELLAWGLPAPGRNQGLPDSFLVRALLATQPGSTALFSSALSDDKDASGREQVQRALEALAEDPLFKRVLDYTSSKVREAFTATGRKQQGRTHFWKLLQAELNEADAELERLQRQKAESDAVIGQLDRLEAELELAQQALSKAQAEQAAFARRLTQQAQLVAAEQRAKAATQQHQRITREEQALTEAEQRRAHAAEAQSAAEQALAAATEQRNQAQQARDAAARQLQSLEGDAAAAGRALELERLQASASRQETALSALSRDLQQLQSAQQKLSLAETSAQRALELGAQAEQAQVSHAALSAEQAKLLAEQKQLQQLAAFLSLRSLTAERARLAPQQQAFEADEATRQSLHSEYTELSARLGERQLPSPAELQALRQLERERDVAHARLNVGLELSITPETPGLKVLLGVDGKPRKATLKAEQRFGAERELHLELPGVAKLAIVAGSAEHRALAAELSQRFEAQASPVLRAAKAESLQEVEALLSGAQRLEQLTQQREQLERSGAQATELARRLEQLDANIDAARNEIGADALKRLTKQLEAQLDGPLFADPKLSADAVLRQQQATQSAACAARLAELEQQLSAAEAAQREAELEQRVQADRAEQEQRTADSAAAAIRTDLQASAGVPCAADTPLPELEHALQSAIKQASFELSATQQRLEQQAGGEDAELAQAGAELAARDATLQAALDAHEQAQGAWVEAKTALAVAESELAGQRKALEAEDVQLIREEYTRATAAVSAERATLATLVGCHPDDLSLVSEAEEQQAQHAVDAAQGALRLKQREIDTLRGSLTQVGGDVIEEALADARAAQAQLRAQLEDKEHSFAAWKLLEEVLQEAEQQGDGNLGAALAGPVAERFAQLTKGRYASLKLNAQLQTEGVGVEGSLREVTQLSAGTQEQLATLLRLTLAEQLQTTLILDDHLTQTDSLRMRWFREKLYEVAERTQIIVVTCWPEHFMLEGASAHRVDLQRVIQRD